MSTPQASMLPDGRRLHLNHGPIDLIVEAFGALHEREAAYAQATRRFSTVLTELVAELPELRQPARLKARAFISPIAARMERAVCPLAAEFITPLAAVAGSVAEEILASMLSGRELRRAYVNNGGDVALFLSAGTQMRAAIAGTGHGFDDSVVIRAIDPVRGIATSGWRGRSHSFGIADAVTVLATTAAKADAAATVIANAVDLPGHAAIERTPANQLAPDTDLGGRRVTTGVGPLSAREVDEALDNGLRVARKLISQGIVMSAALFLAGESRIAGSLEQVEQEHIAQRRYVHG